MPRALGTMIDDPYRDTKLGSLFIDLCGRMGIRNADLLEAKLGNAFSTNLNGRKLVAVSPLLIQSLSGEEVEAVLAHELSHVKNRDSLAKGLARFARFAFPFDPVIRLAEAALHRERELLADSSSVRYTGKPLALASALIKVHSGSVPAVKGIGAGLFVGGRKNGLLSHYPNLERRIELLLKLAKTTKVAVPA